MSKPLIEIADAGPLGMITLRGDLASSKLQEALAAAQREMPGPSKVTGTAGAGVLWMSPDEVMVTCAQGEADALVEQLAKALAGDHALAVNVSDARAVFRLSGDNGALREVLAKLSPADLRPGALDIGQLRRTRLAQVPAAFWFEAEDSAVLIAFRLVGEYVAELLANAAKAGSDVGYF